MRKITVILFLTVLIFMSGLWFYKKEVKTSINKQIDNSQNIYTYQIVNSYPHDTRAFTQGLIYHDGLLYVGTGLRGHSSLRKVELETGKVLKLLKLPSRFFGEGITIWNDKIIQLTWTSNVGFVYNRETFEKLANFSYPTDGWGITDDGKNLIMSDGTNNLYFLNPETFERIRTIKVTEKIGDNQIPVEKLNELEYINGEIFANVWLTDNIVRISPETGEVLGKIDLTGLIDLQPIPAQGIPQNVLNGIAYDKENNRLFVTGKLWPKLFEIKLTKK